MHAGPSISRVSDIVSVGTRQPAGRDPYSEHSPRGGDRSLSLGRAPHDRFEGRRAGGLHAGLPSPLPELARDRNSLAGWRRTDGPSSS